MSNKNYQEMVYQWKNHEVTIYLLRQFHQNRIDIVNDLVSTKITSDTMHDKNFKLGKLELLNEVLDDDFFNDLIESLQEGGDQ